jgi:hypothetical protein
MTKRILWLLALLAYITSLFFPALYGGGTSVGGVTLLLFGWVQTLDGQCYAWLANPTFFAAFTFFILSRFKIATGMSLLACLIALDTFRATRFPPNEAYTVAIDAIGTAFYIWMASFIFLALASLYMAWANATEVKKEPLYNHF